MGIRRGGVPIAKVYDPPFGNFNNACLDEIGESSTEVTRVYGVIKLRPFPLPKMWRIACALEEMVMTPDRRGETRSGHFRQHGI